MKTYWIEINEEAKPDILYESAKTVTEMVDTEDMILIYRECITQSTSDEQKQIWGTIIDALIERQRILNSRMKMLSMISEI